MEPRHESTTDETARKHAEDTAAQRADQLATFSERLKQLHRLSTSTYDDINTLLDDYLRTGCEIFDMKAAAINQVDGERCVFRATHAGMAGFEEGSVYHMSKMYCEAVIRQNRTITYPNAHRVEALSKHPAYRDLNVQSYIGTPILVNGAVYGVLLFVSDEPRETFTAEDREIVELMAQGVGRFIAQELAERERSQAMEASRESEERYRRLVNSVKDYAIFMLDPDGYVTSWNAGAERIEGYAANEIIGRHFSCFYTEADREKGKPQVALDTARRKGYYEDEGVRVRKDGSLFWVHALLTPVYDEQGALRGFSKVTRDVTERKEAEQALREQEQQLARAQRIAHLGSWEWDVQTGQLTWSDELYRIYGLEPDDGITYEKYIRCIHPDDRARVEGIVQNALQTHEPFGFYHRIVRPDGTERTLHGEGEVLVDEDGTVLRMFGTGHDVTERKQAEEELRESEQRFRLLAENMTDLVSLHDPTGHYLYLSPSVERILGYSPEELIGTTPFALAHPDDVESFRQKARELRLQKRYAEITVRAQTKSGDYIWLDVNAKPVVNEQGEVVCFQANTRNVTERVRAEQKLAQSNEALERRNRELQDFAYVASHDLQEPLRKIRAFADLLRDDYEEVVDANGQYYLDRIQDGAQRMSRLISDLLNYSRITSKARPFQRVDLERITAEVISDLEIRISEAEGSVDVGTLPVIEADPTQMRQLLQNLIGNAFKFRREDARPVVRIGATVERDGSFAEVDAHKTCRLIVQDNGIGFEERYLDRIFTPFQRLHGRDQYAGTGMGLAICRRIVERHHGHITAESEPGAGTTFVVTLPVHQPNEQKENEGAA